VSDTTNIFEQSPDLDTFGGRLSRARDASGLSLKDLAWRLSVKMATLQAWENDRSQPSSHRLSILTGLLGVSISWLLHGVGTGPAEADEPSAGMDAPSPEIFAEQLSQLKLLHVETGQFITRIQGYLDGMQAGLRR
jgi:transcriptional regulator with XRE-family HTH domain